MRPTLRVLLLAVLPLAACDGDPTCSLLDTPQSPPFTFDGGSKTAYWSPVANATSYNVYMKAVDNCDQLDTNVNVTSQDQKFANATSPFDVSSFDRCRVCYYMSVTAANGSCESATEGTVGFTLLPCRP
jgi:hypothetical protein